MRRTTHLAIGTVVAAFVGVVSCDGGVGGLDPTNGGWDYDRGNLSQRERPFGLQDPPANGDQPTDRVPGSNENAPVSGGGSGGGAFVCSGIYECVLSGRTQSCVTTREGGQECTPGQTVTIRVRIPLEEKGGACFIGEAVLEPDGTFRGEDDDEVGTWSRQGNGIFIQAGETSGLCVPSSGPIGVVGGDDSSREGSGSSSGDESSDSASGSDGTDG